jgi:hypothetical protein
VSVAPDLECPGADGIPAVTAGGHQLTESDIDALAEEAEAGYDLDTARRL